MRTSTRMECRAEALADEKPSPDAEIATREKGPERALCFHERGLAELPTLRRASRIEPSLPVVLVFNLVVAVMLALALGRRVSLPCVPPQATVWGLVIFLHLLFHLVWRYIGPAIREISETIEVGPLAVPIKVLASLFDTLHPWRLSGRDLWVWVIVLFLAAVILGLSLLFLSPLPPEETPIVRSFSVQYLERIERNGTTMSFKPSDVVEVMADEQVLVKAETLGQADVLCTWSTANGNLQHAGMCSILYSAPFYGTYDTLDILAQSPCKTQDACAGLHVKIVPRNQ